jgi:hypothetical protein
MEMYFETRILRLTIKSSNSVLSYADELLDSERNTYAHPRKLIVLMNLF